MEDINKTIENKVVSAVSKVFSYPEENLCDSFPLYQQKPKSMQSEVGWGVLKYFQEKNNFFEVLNILEDQLHINISDAAIDGTTLGSFMRDIKNYVKSTGNL